MTAPGAKAVLLDYLQNARESVVWKLEGLPEHDVRRPLTPTGTNLLGLVKHLAHVELTYLGDAFGRPAPAAVRDPAAADGGDEEDLEHDMWVRPDESRDDVVGLYRLAWAHADQTVAALDLDAPGEVAHWGPGQGGVTLHQVLVHLVAETCRHAGHADVLRERLDGRAGRYTWDAGPGLDDPAVVAARVAHVARVQAAADAVRGPTA